MRQTWLAAMAGVLALALSGVRADEGTSRQMAGSVALSLSQDGGGERWQVRARDAVSGRSVEGTVRVSGVPLERPDKLGKVDWQISGTALSGTVSVTGGPVMAWFKGTVSKQRISGSFNTVTGESGSWVWEGPIPEGVQ